MMLKIRLCYVRYLLTRATIILCLAIFITNITKVGSHLTHLWLKLTLTLGILWHRCKSFYIIIQIVISICLTKKKLQWQIKSFCLQCIFHQQHGIHSTRIVQLHWMERQCEKLQGNIFVISWPKHRNLLESEQNFNMKPCLVKIASVFLYR